MEDDDDVFISTNMEAAGIVPSYTFSEPPSKPDLRGAIVLNKVDNAIALQGFEKSYRIRKRDPPVSTLARQQKRGKRTRTRIS